jgi:Holliday junction resolvasome RuvABC endonuclease subunit
MRILSLDVSTKTGWSLCEVVDNQLILVQYGQIPKIDKPDAPYPKDYVWWADDCFKPIIKILMSYKYDILVIEETSSGSYSNLSQKILEYIHMKIATFITETDLKITVKYYMSEQWRRIIGCKMTKEESDHNKQVKKYKQKNNTSIAYDEQGKRIGKLTKKHLNIARVNEYFGLQLKLKDNDTADAIGLCLAYFKENQKEKQKDSIWEISGTKTM